MVKKIIHDIVKKSEKPKAHLAPLKQENMTQDEERRVPIRLASRARQTTTQTKRLVSTSAIPSRTSFEPINLSGQGGGRLALWALAIASFVFLLFSFSFLFSRATVTVLPRFEEFLLQTSLSAPQNSSQEFSFELMALSLAETKILTATETKPVEKQAQGKVIVYNSYSSSPQKLLVDTRLSTPEGKIFKTAKAVMVPGAFIKDGQMIPGSVLVSIYAEKPGEEYNLPPSDFNIIGFKGTPKYSKFYARSKDTGPSGGLIGTMPIISVEAINAAKDVLRENLKTKLISKAQAEVPNSFVLYDDAIFIDFSQKELIEPILEKSFNLIETANLNAFIFDKQKLTQKIITEVNLPDRSEGLYQISDLRSFNFTLKNKDQINPASVKNIDFTLSGPVRVIWPVDSDKVIASLVGQKKKDFKSILGRFDNINQAELLLKPFWKFKFPGDKSKIKVKITPEASTKN